MSTNLFMERILGVSCDCDTEDENILLALLSQALKDTGR